MANDTPTMEQNLAQLRMSYAEKLTQRIDALSDSLQGLSSATNTTERMEALEPVRFAAHKLAGSAATFGFPAVSDIAHTMDVACHDVLNCEGKDCSEGLLDRLYTLCGELREAAKVQNDDLESETHEIITAARGALHPVSKQRAVVVMDCDRDESAQMKLEMEHFGFDVHVIDHPTKLPAELDKGKIDVLVSDLAFSGNSQIALEILTELREKERIDMPLVIHTEIDDMEARLGAARVGAKAYLVKPVDMADLVNELDEVTHRTEQEPFRVLVIDDDESLARHTELVLQGAGMETFALTDPMEVLEALDDFSPELILLDLYMPNCSGSEIASVIRQREAYAGVPIVFLSGESDKDKQLLAMELGGDDFLTKPIRPGHLISAVRIRASRFRELRSFMVRDSMTGLYNHTTTKQLMETEIARAHRSGVQLSLAALDIDLFKNVNDTYGHAVGDRVIKALSRLMRQRLRSVDIIGRMGGEEFAAILPETPADEAEVVFNQIREAFSDIRFHANNEAFSVTISCGIAEFPEHDTATMLSDAADKALYAAKRAGRNQVIMAE